MKLQIINGTKNNINTKIILINNDCITKIQKSLCRKIYFTHIGTLNSKNIIPRALYYIIVP